MNTKEPIKHHYIPRFLLKAFCFDDKDHIYYYDKKTLAVSEKNIRNVFMCRNLYRDEINCAEEPSKIEKDLARFEGEISHIIKDKFLQENDISIIIEEDEKLKLFFSIMGFRAKSTSKQFGTEASDDSKVFYSFYQDNGDLTDLWKRNLGIIVNCRSLKEVLSHKDIDDPFKAFFRIYTKGILGTYFIVIERRGPEDFIISDCYPTVIKGLLVGGLELIMYSIFPISPDRIILLAHNGVEGAPKSIAEFSKEVFRKPKMNTDGHSITIHVKKIYAHDVKYVNSILMKDAQEGFAFKSKRELLSSKCSISKP